MTQPSQLIAVCTNPNGNMAWFPVDRPDEPCAEPRCECEPRLYVPVDALLSRAALEAAHWKLDGTLCDYNEDTNRYEPIEADEETVLHDCLKEAVRVIGALAP